MSTMAEKLISFYSSIQPPDNLPQGIEILFPQRDPKVMSVISQFFIKYFNDEHPRGLMLGINPGRYGAGITGVNFTAPKQLQVNCGIGHHFKNSSELSAEFIYEMILAYGGVKEFYGNWFLGSVCPLGFTISSKDPEERVRGSKIQNEKNINYYDDKNLLEAVTPFIIDCINKQVDMGFRTENCLCIGGEKNFKFLSWLNEKHKWFGRIIPLPHPRFILQYRRKQKDKYIHQYLMAMKDCS